MSNSWMPDDEGRKTKDEGRTRALVVRLSSFVIVTLLAFGLRIWNLDAQSLWWDEGFSLNLAEQSIRQIIYGDFHPPLYHLLLAGWIRIAGTSDFAARYLSLIIGTLMVPLGYRLALRLFDRRTGLVAALLVAASPVLVWYSQEARMYGLLALEYLALLVLFHRLIDPNRSQARRSVWLAFALVEIAALYTHYFATLGIAWLTLAVLLRSYATRNAEYPIPDTQSPIPNLLLTQTLVTLAYLPWIPVFLSLQGRYTTPFATPPSPRTFFDQVWHGYNAGSLALVGHHELFMMLSTVAGGLLAIGLAVALLRDPRRSALLWLLGHTLVPLGAIFVLMQVRPFFHPRYTVMLAAPLLIVVARVGTNLQSPISNNWRLEIGDWRLGIGNWRLIISLAFFLTFAVAIHTFTTDPRYQRDDIRGLARTLAQTAGPEDVIVFDYLDHPFRRYYDGEAPVVFLDLGQPDAEVARRLATALEGHRRALRVTWNQAPVDARGLVSWLLASAGYREEVRPWGDLAVHSYVLERSVPMPRFAPLSADFGILRLAGVHLPQAWPRAGGVPVALHWQATGSPGTDLKVALRLQDARGHVLAQADVLLLDTGNRPTSAWAPGTEAISYVVLSLPRGTPPGDYRVSLRVYDPATLHPLERRDIPGPEVELGTLRLHRADFQATAPELPGFMPVDVELGPLTLEGFALNRRQVSPGERLSVALRWRTKGAAAPIPQPQVRLMRGDALLAQANAPLYPTSRWAGNPVILDWRDLTVPATASPGPVELEVRVGDARHTLASVTITAVERRFEPPAMSHSFQVRFGNVAELLGYDLTPRVRTGQPVELTLYWRALGASEIGYTVFTHLLDQQGVLVGQHDGVPADGARPTTGWVRGEIIVDRHVMTFKVPGYTGTARIAIGLYDPVTGQRLTTPAGADHVILPTSVEVLP